MEIASKTHHLFHSSDRKLLCSVSGVIQYYFLYFTARYAEMEEKYFIATKEKEGLEDALEKSSKEVHHPYNFAKTSN